MEKELQGKLVEILTGIQNAVGRAADFTMGQLPDIAQQYIMYARAINTTIIVLALIWICVIPTLAIKYHNKHKNERGYDGFVPWFPTVVTFVPCVVIFSVHLSSFFMVWLAPKVWLIKEIANLIK